MRPARAATCRRRSAAADNSPSCARRPRPRWLSVSARSMPARAVLGSTPVRSPCSRHAPAAPCHRRPLARRPGARRHRDSGLGRDLLSAGLDRAADRSRTRLVDDLCHGRLFARLAHGGAGFAARRIADRPARRTSCHAIGSLLAALALALIVYADHPAAYLAVWLLLGVATAATLYDPAFATLGRIFGAAARRPITALTLAGGFASTV